MSIIIPVTAWGDLPSWWQTTVERALDETTKIRTPATRYTVGSKVAPAIARAVLARVRDGHTLVQPCKRADQCGHPQGEHQTRRTRDARNGVTEELVEVCIDSPIGRAWCRVCREPWPCLIVRTCSEVEEDLP